MFKNAKVGDRVWDFLYKHGEIVEKTNTKIQVRFKNPMKPDTVYDFEGKIIGTGYPQTLFWNEIKFELPMKPFDLEDELRKLEIIEFENGAVNYHLFWDNEYSKIKQSFVNYSQNPFDIFFTEDSLFNFIDNIKNKKKITKKEFFTAYKNVFGVGKF